MSEPYEEILSGRTVTRSSPGSRHEQICGRLHERIQASVADLATTRLLGRREQVKLPPDSVLRPDLALITTATGKLWLAAEIVDSNDHRIDTVHKKQLYEESRIPRLWMIDPRYDNVEVYYGGEYGLMLKGILAGREILSESLLPEFQITVDELFRMQTS